VWWNKAYKERYFLSKVSKEIQTSEQSQEKNKNKIQKKQLKCKHCSMVNHNDDHGFQIHQEVQLFV